MSLKVIEDLCIGCGACEYACPTGALAKTDSYLGLFSIDPLTCDDCNLCVDKCPTFAIVPDVEWAACKGKGCPLGSDRLSGIECSVWQDRCESCGTTLWRAGSDGSWECPRCGMERKVVCPRSRTLAQLRDADPDRFGVLTEGAGSPGRV